MSGRPSAGGKKNLFSTNSFFPSDVESHIVRSWCAILRYFFLSRARARIEFSLTFSLLPDREFQSCFSQAPLLTTTRLLFYLRRLTQTPRHWVWIQYRRQRSCPEQFHSQVLHGRFSWLENHPGGRFGHVRVLHRFRNHLTRDVEDLSIQDGLILVLNVADYLVNLQ